ncbi:MAG: hypothetical protein ABL914_06045 [Novosphingobium sp.]|uniref:hypothetical protein n=1 Tax=Novosphingobium sp. TaxID=1874826 RepID=UPI0032BD8E4A
MSADIIARGLAAAQARSANTQVLQRAIRTNAFFPQPLWRCPANDVATITVPAASAASTIAGTNYVSFSDASRIKWLAGAANKDGNGNFFARGTWYVGGRTTNYASFEIEFVGSKFEFILTSSAIDGVSQPNLRVLVGDRIAGTAAVPADGGARHIAVQFPAAAARRVRIEVAGGAFYAMKFAALSEVSPVKRNYPLVTVIGDSFGEGTGTIPYDGEAISAIRAIGCNCALAAVGGTGILNPGAGGKVNWQDANRLSDLALNGFTDQISGSAPNPAMAVIMMSVNDNAMGSANWGGAATYQAAVAKGLFALIDHWQTQRPGKPLVVFGPTWPNENPTLDIFRIRDAGQEVCHGTPNVWFIDRLGPGPALRKGTLSSTATTGTLTNASKIISALGSVSGVGIGSAVIGSGIPAGARVASIDSASQITLDVNAAAGGAGVALLFRNDAAALYTTTSDSTHPSASGHNHDALWMARQLHHLIFTQFA